MLLAGGNSKIVYLHPWGNDPIWRTSFPKGLKPPPSLVLFQICVPFEGEIRFCLQNNRKTLRSLQTKSRKRKNNEKRTVPLRKMVHGFRIGQIHRAQRITVLNLKSMMNHGSGKWPIWRLNTSARTPFSTSMIMGGRVKPLLFGGSNVS